MKSFTHPFFHLLVLALLTLVLFAVATFGGVVLGVALPVDGGSTDGFLFRQALAQVLVFAVPVWCMTWLYYRDDWRGFCRFDLGGRRWLLALAGVVVLLLLVPLTDWLSVWNDGWHLPAGLEDVERRLREMGQTSQDIVGQMIKGGNLWVCLFCVALVPAVCEELFFRVGVQNLLQRWFKNVHVAVWVTAALFSLAHGEVFAFLPRFLLGGLLGYLYVGGRSLVVNMTVHFVNNAVVVLLYALPTSIDPTAPLAVGWELTLCCTLAAVAVMVSTYGNNLKISR